MMSTRKEDGENEREEKLTRIVVGENLGEKEQNRRDERRVNKSRARTRETTRLTSSFQGFPAVEFSSLNSENGKRS